MLTGGLNIKDDWHLYRLGTLIQQRQHATSFHHRLKEEKRDTRGQKKISAWVGITLKGNKSTLFCNSLDPHLTTSWNCCGRGGGGGCGCGRTRFCCSGGRRRFCGGCGFSKKILRK